jgi:branched-chain amino acid transport system substrate-binding protein
MRQAIVRLPRMRLLFAALIAIAITGGVAAASSGAATARAAASKSTWVIGNIGTYSGINSGNFLGGGQALQAWADWTNANGGIDGHHVKVISLDDAGVASTSVNDVKQLVQSDHVLAIVATTPTGRPTSRAPACP